MLYQTDSMTCEIFYGAVVDILLLVDYTPSDCLSVTNSPNSYLEKHKKY